MRASQRAGARRVRFNVETRRRADRPETIGDGFDGTSPGPFERAIAAEVDARGLGARVVLQSFDHRSDLLIERARRERGARYAPNGIRDARGGPG